MMPNGGPFFPVQDISKWQCPGASLRDWFAGKALQGMYAGHASTADGYEGLYAHAAYAIADAMLAERDKQ